MLRIIQSDVCETCGYITLSGRLMRLFLQVIAVFMLLSGLVSFKESLLAGTILCLAAISLFVVATHNFRVKAKKLLEMARNISARTSKWALIFLFLVLIVVPAWIWFDASFQSALTWARIDLGIPDEEGRALIMVNSMVADYLVELGLPTLYQRSHSLSFLGPRIGVMLFIMCGSMIFIPLGAMHIVLNGASKKYVIIFMILVCSIVALVNQRDSLLWYAVRHRISNDLPRFQRALEPLLQEWPTTSGTLPEAGDFFAHERLPGQLMIHNATSYGTRETFGAVSQLPDKAISFSLNPHYMFQLEYHPPGSSGPRAKIPEGDWTSHLTRSERIAEGWYLTQYDAVRN